MLLDANLHNQCRQLLSEYFNSVEKETKKAAFILN